MVICEKARPLEQLEVSRVALCWRRICPQVVNLLYAILPKMASPNASFSNAHNCYFLIEKKKKRFKSLKYMGKYILSRWFIVLLPSSKKRIVHFCSGVKQLVFQGYIDRAHLASIVDFALIVTIWKWNNQLWTGHSGNIMLEMYFINILFFCYK